MEAEIGFHHVHAARRELERRFSEIGEFLFTQQAEVTTGVLRLYVIGVDLGQRREGLELRAVSEALCQDAGLFFAARDLRARAECALVGDQDVGDLRLLGCLRGRLWFGRPLWHGLDSDFGGRSARAERDLLRVFRLRELGAAETEEDGGNQKKIPAPR